MNKAELYELGERASALAFYENTGPERKRLSYLKDRFLDAQIEAALIEEPVCTFKNKWGWCKLPEGHKGSHTVVDLGDSKDE